MASILPNTTNKRRFHHKSRYGCVPCKRRRTKCDEKKPICTNCSQRLIKCSFSDLVPAPRSQRLSTTAKHQARIAEHSIPAKVSGPGLAFSFCRQGTRDLELYCHFQIFIVPTLADPGDLAALFRDEIPKQSVSFPFVGHGLLSIAYIHFADLSQHEHSKKLLLADGAFHINRALPDYLASIKNITKENFCPVYEFAIFVVLFTFAMTSEDCSNLLQTAQASAAAAATNQLWKQRNLMTDLAKKAAQVAQSIQNIFGIFWRCQEWFASSPVFPTVQRHTPPMLSAGSMNWIRVEDGHLASLSRLWEEDVMVPLEYSGALSDSLACLRETFAMVTQLTVLPPTDTESESASGIGLSDDLREIHRQLSVGRIDDMPCVFTWFVRLSPTLIGLLESSDPHAMVILAHYAIVLDRACSEKWWIHRLPRRFVQIAELVLGEERRAWMDWPLMVVSE